MTLKKRHLRGAQVNRTMYSGEEEKNCDVLFRLVDLSNTISLSVMMHHKKSTAAAPLNGYNIINATQCNSHSSGQLMQQTNIQLSLSLFCQEIQLVNQASALLKCLKTQNKYSFAENDKVFVFFSVSSTHLIFDQGGQ